jgi:monovalent cation:H+ antiporter-2, CPA2 family
MKANFWGGTDVGTTSSFVLPMVGTMTIITTFIIPYLIKMGCKLVENSDNIGRKFSLGFRGNKK